MAGIGDGQGHPHHQLVTGFAAGTIDLEELQERLLRSGTPLCGTVADGLVDVTFVIIAQETGAHPGVSYRLRSLIDRALPTDRQLERVGDSPVHALTLRLPADLRFSYGIEREDASGDVTLVDDPANRRLGPTDARLSQPIAVLPEAEDLPVLRSAAADIVPRTDEVMINSLALGERRRIWVSSPDHVGSGPLPVVIIFDGAADHSAPAVRDVLLAEGAIVPVLVVLVDPEDRRARDLTGYPAFSRFLIDDVLPLLRERYAASVDPGQVVLSGSSFGGLCAGWTALHHPDSFGGAIMQSPSCWYHPDLPGPQQPADARVGAPVPTLIAAFEQTPPAPIRLYQEVGRLEFGPPPAQVWQVHGNRWLHRILVDQGYDTVYREFAGGHDAAWWRGSWARGLSWHFPAA